ncbi:nucleotidyl transferase AbiEii/AbiGii toxin family protein [Curtobacterium sp. MCLR17_032]|uniref:nucleotidyl transferase AbiEii/AbiGii toxin family protein n=1 Tax=Curtobacterium sp. MCLR17_032 TaxID=2175650 RepID=UPI000DA94B26|nr:nucleotidyl transferase AbiEii/AbiGii toxin family protein [Curtobacterium sp. MCLR17_032]WIE62234.1 nucleotidyl transferase AbiEii/AbiGii toxin family protein [Curtobacterium sp. MCLR17_032]
MAQLRGSADLAALIPTVSDALSIPEAYVEKDFWATEALRALTEYADGAGAPAIFKGGTSLSKAWKLTERFSEDIDIVLDFPDDMSKGQRERLLKGVADAVDAHLGLGAGAYRSANQTRAVARNVFVTYPILHPAASLEVKPEVLLEIGSRGAPTPNESVSILSFAAEYLVGQGLTPADFDELTPVQSHVLVTERTLIEKVALLANRDARYRAGESTAFEGLGRHLYDVHALLNDSDTKENIALLGDDGIRAVATDVHDRSIAANWSSVARPDEGWIAAADCFTSGSASSDALAAAYARAAPMIYGDAPTFAACVEVVGSYTDVI